MRCLLIKPFILPLVILKWSRYISLDQSKFYLRDLVSAEFEVFTFSSTRDRLPLLLSPCRLAWDLAPSRDLSFRRDGLYKLAWLYLNWLQNRSLLHDCQTFEQCLVFDPRYRCLSHWETNYSLFPKSFLTSSFSWLLLSMVANLARRNRQGYLNALL